MLKAIIQIFTLPLVLIFLLWIVEYAKYEAPMTYKDIELGMTKQEMFDIMGVTDWEAYDDNWYEYMYVIDEHEGGEEDYCFVKVENDIVIGIEIDI